MKAGEVRAAVWAGLLATFVAVVAGAWFPGLSLPRVDMASLNGDFLAPEGASASFAWTVGLLQLFAGGVVVALLYALYIQALLPGPGWFRGMLWGAVLCLVSGLTLFPLIYGGGVFGAEWDSVYPLALTVWYLLWGAVVGIAYHMPRAH
jgi:hypothetical protein